MTGYARRFNENATISFNASNKHIIIKYGKKLKS